MFISKSEKEFNDFNTVVGMIVNVLILQDKELVKTCEQTLIGLLGSEETTHIMNAAMFQLAEIAPDTCYWTWRNFPHLNSCLDLKEYIVMFAAQKLIEEGFILGQDFSSTSNGDILLNEKAKSALKRNSHSCEWVFLEEVLEIA